MVKIVLSFPPPFLDPPVDPPGTPSLSSLPDDIIMNSLARIPKSYYPSLCSVSGSFNSLLSSPEIYTARSQIGNTEPRVYVCLYSKINGDHNLLWFTLKMNPIEEGEYLSLVPVRFPSFVARLKSTYVAVGYEIYQIGGLVNYVPSKAVSVLDCRTHTWRSAPNLTVPRERARSCLFDGKIYVFGGHTSSLIWGEVFDIKTQTWTPLPTPNVADSKFKVVILEGRLHIVTMTKNFAYDAEQGRWLPDVGLVVCHEPEPVVHGHFCVINNVLFGDHDGKYKWYYSTLKEWRTIANMGPLYMQRDNQHYQSTHLGNCGGKLVIMWHQWNYKIVDRVYVNTDHRRILCAVVRLEQRMTCHGPEIFGEVELCNIVEPRIHMSYNPVIGLSVSV